MICLQCGGRACLLVSITFCGRGLEVRGYRTRVEPSLEPGIEPAWPLWRYHSRQGTRGKSPKGLDCAKQPEAV
ncbi:hypothetical protein BDW68DRAFT_69849 [Aspergillus falconensis]